jgi:PhnB protein
MPTPYIPEGYHTVTPYLAVNGAAKLLDFLKATFGAQEKEMMRRPDGTIGHAEVTIGNSVVMLGEAAGDFKPTPATLYVYVEDADAIYARALAAGATSIRPPETQFYGDRHGAVTDPVGNSWWIATHVEDVPPDEMMRRAQAAMH